LRLASLLLCLAAAWSTLARAEPEFAALVTSVVRVRALAPDGALRLGSGIVIAQDEVATACHVTRNASSIEILRGAGRWTARSQTGSVVRDVCVLSVAPAQLDMPVAQLRDSSELRAGDRVFAASFAGGRRKPLVSEGSVEALYAYDGGEVILTTAMFDFGSSGGALLDDAGRVVGLLAFKSGVDDRRFAVPSEWIGAATHAAKVDFPLDRNASPVAFWERSLFGRPGFLDIRSQATSHVP
jgi:S1-C subfamily serine protease